MLANIVCVCSPFGDTIAPVLRTFVRTARYKCTRTRVRIRSISLLPTIPYVGPYDARLYRTWYIPTDISVLVPRRYLYCTHTNDELTEYAALDIQAHTNGQPNCRRYAVSD